MKKSDIAWILIIVCVGIGLLATPILLRLSVFEKDVVGTFELPSSGKNISDIDINVQTQGGIINILELNEDSANFVEVNWDITHTGVYIPELCVLITYTLNGPTIKININSLVESIHIVKLILNISFNPSYNSYSFLFNTESGSLNSDISGLNINHFEFRSSSGDLNLILNNSNIKDDFQLFSDSGELRLKIDNTNFSKNIICQAYSGIQFFDLWNIRFESSGNFDISTVVGYSKIEWANHYNKSHKVNVNINTNGMVAIKFWCPIEIMRSDICANIIDGQFDFIAPTGIFTELSETHFQSPNIADMTRDAYNISVNSHDGDIEVKYVDCFKWQRDCNQANDFHPYNVTKSGNYSILVQDHTISSINLYNRNYIYLNESRSLVLNYEALPFSSEKIIYVDWYIKYLHAMGIGKSDILVKVSNNTSYDILSVFIALEYELDRILPTFSDYNITVYYNPSYTFNPT